MPRESGKPAGICSRRWCRVASTPVITGKFRVYGTWTLLPLAVPLLTWLHLYQFQHHCLFVEALHMIVVEIAGVEIVMVAVADGLGAYLVTLLHQITMLS